jgi:hypothetical protein
MAGRLTVTTDVATEGTARTRVTGATRASVGTSVGRGAGVHGAGVLAAPSEAAEVADRATAGAPAADTGAEDVGAQTRPPVRGGWEAIVAHARTLGPDPAHAGLDDAGLEVEVRRAAGAQAAATARMLELIGEFVVRELWVPMGMLTPGQWLSWAIGLAPSTAREMVRVALALRTFTATAERFRRGEVSYSKVRAITRCGEPALEELLLRYADNAPACQLERIVRSFRSLRDDVDPHDDRMMAVRHGDRHVTLTIRVPVEAGLEAVALVDRIVQRLDDEQQPRDPELPDREDVPVQAVSRCDPVSARRADAVMHGLRLAVDHLDADVSAAARTTLVLSGDVDSMIDQLAGRTSDGGEAPPASAEAGTLTGGLPSAESETPTEAATLLAGDPAAGRDAADEASEQGLALAAGSGSMALVARSSGLVRLSRHVVRALSCDARVRRVVTSGGTPVDVGRTHRLVTWRLRQALRSRDGSCRFPGCAATRHLHAHHVVHWADGGPTDMGNLVLLCGAHHRFVHSRGWVIERGPRGSGWSFRAPDAAHVPSVLPPVAAPAGASAEAARGRDPSALEPAGWDGARLDLDAAIDIMWQELGRIPGVLAGAARPVRTSGAAAA